MHPNPCDRKSHSECERLSRVHILWKQYETKCQWLLVRDPSGHFLNIAFYSAGRFFWLSFSLRRLCCIKLCHPSRLTRYPGISGFKANLTYFAFAIYIRLCGVWASHTYCMAEEGRQKKIKYIFRHRFRCDSVTVASAVVALVITLLLLLVKAVRSCYLLDSNSTWFSYDATRTNKIAPTNHNRIIFHPNEKDTNNT